jgi:uncharacterized protein (DUF433 family)
VAAEVRTVSDIRFVQPLYTVAEAARIVDVPTSTFTRWVRGYERRPPGRAVVIGAPLLETLPAQPGSPSLPFIAVAEAMVLAAIRRQGVPMQRIRPALDVLRRQLGLEHALATQRLYTEGAEVLLDYADHAGQTDAAEAVRELVVVRSGQRVFTEVVEGYLRRISFAADGWAERLSPPRYREGEVIVDPRFSFGQPTFLRGRARVSDVLERFWAGEDLSAVAAEFGVPVAHVEDVVRVASRAAA